jgi:hypothetical protein
MKTHAEPTDLRPRRLDAGVVAWRFEQLVAAGFLVELAAGPARDSRLDLHALIELVERGCRPDLAVRILAPLDTDDREVK